VTFTLPLQEPATQPRHRAWPRPPLRALRKILCTLGVTQPTPAFMTKFAVATQFNRVLAPDMKLSAVMDLCHRNEDKLHNFLAFSYTRLSVAMASVRNGARQ
jgi:hypothetical protein